MACALVTTCASLSLLPGPSNAPEQAPLELGVGERLSKLGAITRVKHLGSSGERELFVLDLQQRLDHEDPNSPTFVHRMYLFHRSYDAPTVLLTTGYGLGAAEVYSRFEPEVTKLLDANQIVMGHRFFPGALPSDEHHDWTKVTIRQAAGDSHRVVEVLGQVYPEAWVGTGWSKGGMTSIFHERFHPDDLALVVPMVAPISRSVADARYPGFLAQIGETACRARVEDVVIGGLERLDELVEEHGLPPDEAKTLRARLQHTIVFFPWPYWQYLGPRHCDRIPDARSADAADLIEFFYLYSRTPGLAPRIPFGSIGQVYPFQAMTELGTPDYLPAGHLEKLERLGHLSPDDVAWFRDAVARPGSGTSDWNTLPPHDPGAMTDIDRWLREDAEDVLAIYGEHDPWTAAKVTLNEARRSRVFTAPGTTHATYVRDLAMMDYLEVRARILELRPEHHRHDPPRLEARDETDRELLNELLIRNEL